TVGGKGFGPIIGDVWMRINALLC
ncbi:MAG: hypothetical protein RL747_1672, partial [Bacteroidota bacterium]